MELNDLVDSWIEIDNTIYQLNLKKKVLELQINDVVQIDSLVHFCNTGKFLITEENANKRY